MRKRAAITIAILLLGGALLAPTAGDQYGAASWRILKTMMGTATCASGSLCMWGGGTYLVDEYSEIQTALDLGCGADVTGSTQSGCVVEIAKGLYDDVGSTIHLAGTGSSATGRSGVTLRGTGGGSASGTGGNPISGTIIKASGSGHTMLDIGTCLGCTIEGLTFAGEDTATTGILWIDPTGSTPTTRTVIRNVALYEIAGYGLSTPAASQIDTILIENVSVRDSGGCYQQRNTQNIGIILVNFDCSLLGTASGPLFDIQSGEFTLRDSFVAVKNNETAFLFGASVGRVLVDGNQIELGTSSSAKLFDFDSGASTNTSEWTVANNHIVYAASGNTIFEVQRRGAMNVENNVIQNTDSTDRTFVTSFKADVGGTPSANNKLYLKWSGNSQIKADAGDSLNPERWLPTLVINSQSVWPTLLTPTISNIDLPLPCSEGEIGSDYDAAAGSRVKTCIGGAWSAP